MENRESRPQGYRIPDHEWSKVTDAFLQPGKIIKEGDPNMVQLRKANDFLRAIENRASKKGLTAEGSVDVIITAKIQESQADLSKALENLIQKATEAGLRISGGVDQESPGSIVGSIPLKKAPDLAIGMYTHPDIFVVELPQLTPPDKR